MPFGLWSRDDPRNLELDEAQILHEKGQFWGKGTPVVKYRDFLPWAVQKQLNRSICPLGCGLGWAKGSSVIFARWRQCAHMGGHIWRHLPNTIEPSVCGGDAVLCQITLTTCYSTFCYLARRCTTTHVWTWTGRCSWYESIYAAQRSFWWPFSRWDEIVSRLTSFLRFF